MFGSATLVLPLYKNDRVCILYRYEAKRFNQSINRVRGVVQADRQRQGRPRVRGGDQEPLPTDRTAAEYTRTYLVSAYKESQPANLIVHNSLREKLF